MISKKLQLDAQLIYHIIIYDNEFLQRILFPNNEDVFTYKNQIFYQATQQSLEALTTNIQRTDGAVHVYVICSQDCKPSKRNMKEWKPNKIRVFVESLKYMLKTTAKKRAKNLSVKHVVFSGVDLGYVGSFGTTYEKYIV
jgi:hypothetical protein